jgi:hypothetical protein
MKSKYIHVWTCVLPRARLANQKNTLKAFNNLYFIRRGTHLCQFAQLVRWLPSLLDNLHLAVRPCRSVEPYLQLHALVQTDSVVDIAYLSAIEYPQPPGDCFQRKILPFPRQPLTLLLTPPTFLVHPSSSLSLPLHEQFQHAAH